jgi:hypothetical protein
MFIKGKKKTKNGENMSAPELKHKPKEEEQIPLTSIKPQEVNEMLQKGYDEVVNAVMVDLKETAKEYEGRIMAEVKKGNWNKAQKMIDKVNPLFKVDVIGGTKVKVSIADYKGIKKTLADNKKKFVDEVEGVVKTNMTTELVKVRSNWSMIVGTEVVTDKAYKEQVTLLAELLTKNLNGVLGIEPPKGIKPAMVAKGKVPEGKKTDFADATVPKGNLPLYAMHENNEVVIYWPAWIKERRKELAEVVPEKKEEGAG